MGTHPKHGGAAPPRRLAGRVNLAPEDLAAFDAVVLCIGATVPRDLPLPGREPRGIHFAMDFLTQQNRLVAGDNLAAGGEAHISAKGKQVIVIGGGQHRQRLYRHLHSPGGSISDQF